MRYQTIVTTLLLASSSLLAQPTIRDVRSAAGLLPPGLPGYGIARGSLVSIAGTSTDDVTPAALPLSTALNGVSVKVATGGQELDALMVSIDKTRIVALIPSQTPTGTGKIRITDANGTTETPITIVERNFGIFNQKGIAGNVGAAFAMNLSDSDPVWNSLTQTAKPLQQIAILGTGAGATDHDETSAVTAQDLPGDFKLYIGGQLAKIINQGRSGTGIDALGLPAGLSGVDWIKAEVPAGVSGCRVSVVALTDGMRVSNFATISVAADGGTCSDPGFLSSDDINALPASGSYSIGLISITRFTASLAVPPLGTFDLNTDSASASFQRIDVNDFRSSGGAYSVTIGGCIVTYAVDDGSAVDASLLPAQLDAGSAITIKGPKGTTTLRQNPGGDYETVSATGSSSPLFPSQGTPFAEAGAFTADNGSGGADVKNFTANLNNPKPLVWTNQAQITSVQRSQGVNVTWTGGASDATVTIIGSSSAGKISASFICMQRASVGSFQVPAAVTLALPPSATAGGGAGAADTGALILITSTYSRFTAPGLDQAIFGSGGGSLKTVSYK